MKAPRQGSTFTDNEGKAWKVKVADHRVEGWKFLELVRHNCKLWLWWHPGLEAIVYSNHEQVSQFATAT